MQFLKISWRRGEFCGQPYVLPCGSFSLRVSEFAAQFVIGVFAEHEAQRWRF